MSAAFYLHRVKRISIEKGFERSWTIYFFDAADNQLLELVAFGPEESPSLNVPVLEAFSAPST